MAHPCMVLEGINFMLHCNFTYVHVDNNQLMSEMQNKVGCLVEASMIFLVLEVAQHFNDCSVLFLKAFILWYNSIIIFFVNIEKPSGPLLHYLK